MQEKKKKRWKGWVEKLGPGPTGNYCRLKSRSPGVQFHRAERGREDEGKSAQI